jgi:hypothetical protein
MDETRRNSSFSSVGVTLFDGEGSSDHFLTTHFAALMDQFLEARDTWWTRGGVFQNLYSTTPGPAPVYPAVQIR